MLRPAPILGTGLGEDVAALELSSLSTSLSKNYYESLIADYLSSSNL